MLKCTHSLSLDITMASLRTKWENTQIFMLSMLGNSTHFEIFFLFYQKKRPWYFRQILSICMKYQCLFFWEKEEKYCQCVCWISQESSNVNILNSYSTHNKKQKQKKKKKKNSFQCWSSQKLSGRLPKSNSDEGWGFRGDGRRGHYSVYLLPELNWVIYTATQHSILNIKCPFLNSSVFQNHDNKMAYELKIRSIDKESRHNSDSCLWKRLKFYRNIWNRLKTLSGNWELDLLLLHKKIYIQYQILIS